MKDSKVIKYYLDLMMKGQKVYFDYNGLDGGYLLSDSYMMSIVKENYLAKDKMIKVNMEKFLEINFDEYIKVNMVVEDRDNKTMLLLKDNKSSEIKMEYYKLYKGCDFKIHVSDERKPILIYDQDTFKGFILPIVRL